MIAERSAPPAADAESLRAAPRRRASAVAAALSVGPPSVPDCVDRDGRIASVVADHGRSAISIRDRRHRSRAKRLAGRAPLPVLLLKGIARERRPTGNAPHAEGVARFDAFVRRAGDSGNRVNIVGAGTAAEDEANSADPSLYDGDRDRSMEVVWAEVGGGERVR